MTASELARVLVAVVLGLGLASLPFLHYAAHHASAVHAHPEH